jgi:hypothetical protein
MTHAYFCFYHTLSNIVLRRLSHAIKGHSYPFRLALNTAVVVAFSYFTAFMETLTITHVSALASDSIPPFRGMLNVETAVEKNVSAVLVQARFLWCELAP